MKVKQLISILLMLLLLTACSANTDLDLPDEILSNDLSGEQMVRLIVECIAVRR